MSNLIIQNEMDSTLDLTAINDVDGNPVSLWPRGDKRASREITEAASRHESVQRVLDAKWIKLIPLATAGQPPTAEPVPEATPAEPVPEATEVQPPDPTPTVETAQPQISSPTVPASDTRAARRARGA